MNAATEIIAPVDAYATAGDRIDEALDYPGPRPRGSFLTDGEKVHSLPDDPKEFHVAADMLLGAEGLPPINHRIPVLSYGKNASPAHLRAKFSGYKPYAGIYDVEPLMDPHHQAVPHLSVNLPGKLAVWHGVPGWNGSLFAELYASDDPDHSLDTHIAYYTEDQLSKIYATEGPTYDLSVSEMDVRNSTNGRVIEPLIVSAFVGNQSNILQWNGKPVTIRGLGNNAPAMPSASAFDAVGSMLAATEMGTADRTRVGGFISAMMSLPRPERIARQELMQKKLQTLGMSREYTFPA
jgi:hypothetical protein